jgi:molybdopterin molybdotransferase
MIPFEDAFRMSMDAARPVGAERVDLDRALGRILAENVTSDIDMPPFDKAAMDGYACRRQDLGNELVVIETIPCGRVPARSVESNQCAKIMTGAMVPPGADCVIMVEKTVCPTPGTVRFTGETTRDNICPRAEDIRAGDVVLRAGRRITPAHVAVLAVVGCVRPLVRQKVRIGVIATGDEIVEPGESPSPSQIRNSNGCQLVAQAAGMGAAPRYYGIAGDCEDAIDAILVAAAADSDVITLSGGVSMGDYDFVPGVLRRNGFKLLCEKVAIKPGMPTVFGTSDRGSCFALPGNPVSTFILFEVLVKPFLFKMMGHDFRPREFSAPLAKAVRRAKTNRMSWIPVAFTDSGAVAPVEYHGSAHVHALCFADGLISVPVGVAEIKEGTSVHVRPI